MHGVSPLHPQTPSHGEKTVQVLLKNSTHKWAHAVQTYAVCCSRITCIYKLFVLFLWRILTNKILEARVNF